jgi:UDP-N-acetylglucosamine:LPS N-acetylglucosamine transferase
MVEDLPDAGERAKWLWEELEGLMKDEKRRRQMREGCAAVAKQDAAAKVAERVLAMGN